MVFAIMVVVVNLLTDVLYTLIDPRIRLGGGAAWNSVVAGVPFNVRGIALADGITLEQYERRQRLRRAGGRADGGGQRGRGGRPRRIGLRASRPG